MSARAVSVGHISHEANLAVVVVVAITKSLDPNHFLVQTLLCACARIKTVAFPHHALFSEKTIPVLFIYLVKNICIFCFCPFSG